MVKKITLVYEKYLGEVKEELTELLFNKEYRKILLISDTGSGKTTALLDIFRNEKEPFVFAVPYTAIVSQLKGKNLEGVECLSGNQQLKSKENSLIITYDKGGVMKKLNMKERTLIQDEAHTRILSTTYRSDALELIDSYAGQANRVVSVTATPSELLLGQKLDEENSFFNENFNFDLIITCKSTIKKLSKEYNIYFDVFDNRGQAFESFLTTIVEKKEDDRIDIIRVNDVMRLNIMAKKLKSLGFKSSVIHSGNKDSSEIYRLISKEGRIKERIDFILVTSLFDDGLSISGKNIGNLWTFELGRAITIKQFSARPRDGYSSLCLFCFEIMDDQKKPEKPLSSLDINDLILKCYPAFEVLNSVEEELFGNNFLSKNLKSNHFLKLSSNEFDFFNMVNRFYAYDSYLNLCDPKRLRKILLRQYDMDFKILNPAKVTLELGGAIKSSFKDRKRILNSFYNKLNEYGIKYISVYADRYGLFFTKKITVDRFIYHHIEREVLNDICSIEADFIKKYINLRNFGMTHSVARALVYKKTKFVNRIKDSLSYLSFKEEAGFKESIEGSIIKEIDDFIKRKKIEKYNKEDAEEVSIFLSNHYTIPLKVDKNLVMSWLPRIYSVEKKKSGKKRLLILGELSYEHISKELKIPVESLRNNEVSNLEFRKLVKKAVA